MKLFTLLFINSKPSIQDLSAACCGVGANPVQRKEKNMNPLTKKISGACSALFGLIMASAMILAGNPARAAQLPPGCLGNNLSYNIINLNGLNNVTNCTVVTFVSTISQPNDATTCNIILSTNGLLFYCPDATGNPGGSPTLLIPPSTTLAPGYLAKFTNQCTICANPTIFGFSISTANVHSSFST